MLKRVFWVLTGFLVLCGCGGGGGNGSLGVTLPSGYAGNTDPATVTTSNANSLSMGAYSGGQLASSVNVLAIAAVSRNGARPPLVPEVVSILRDSITAVVPTAATDARMLQVVTDHNTVSGFSGSFSYAFELDTASGATTGTLTFSHYQSSSSSSSVDGVVTFSGSWLFTRASSTFSTLDMSMSSLTVDTGSGIARLSGDLKMTTSGSTETVTMTLLVADTSSGKTVLLKDYTLQFDGTSMLMTGRFYHSTYGYVTITTQTPLTVSSPSVMPTSGVLLFTGSNGTKARLTFTATGYTLEADSAGNGAFVHIPV